MKLLLAVLFFVCMLPFTAEAYIEENSPNDASATAGEQNSNLYRLNATSALRIKKLQKRDETLAKNPKMNIRDSSELEEILSDKKQVDLDAKNRLEEQYKETIVKTKNKNALIVSNSEQYEQFKKLGVNSVRDTQAISDIKQKLRRR